MVILPNRRHFPHRPTIRTLQLVERLRYLFRQLGVKRLIFVYPRHEIFPKRDKLIRLFLELKARILRRLFFGGVPRPFLISLLNRTGKNLHLTECLRRRIRDNNRRTRRLRLRTQKASAEKE